MSTEFFLVVLFSVVLTYAQENNQLCECDTEEDLKDNDALWKFLDKLSSDVTDDMKEIYSVNPGNLYQFDCSHCDEKLRKKRRIELAEAPVEHHEEVKEETVIEEDAGEEVDRPKRTININDLRCPKGYVRFARSCIAMREIEGEED